jgi:hypothetical protein
MSLNVIHQRPLLLLLPELAPTWSELGRDDRASSICDRCPRTVEGDNEFASHQAILGVAS